MPNPSRQTGALQLSSPSLAQDEYRAPRSCGGEHFDGLRGSSAAKADVVGAQRSEIPAQGDRRRQMDGVEGPELGRVERSGSWTTSASRSTSAILERPERALRTAPPPIRLATRSTSIRATSLDTRSGQDRRSSRSALVSGSGTTSFTMAEESRGSSS